MICTNNFNKSVQDNQNSKSNKEKLNNIDKFQKGSGDFVKPKEISIMPEAPEEETLIQIQEFEQTLCQRCLPYLHSLREPVADYQAKRGIAKDESYTFYNLVTAVGAYMYSSLSAMGIMMSNLVPIFDAVLLIARFVIDKIIDILEANDNDRMLKAALFLLEFVPVFFIIGFIYGFIFLPLFALFRTVLSKAWGFAF